MEILDVKFVKTYLVNVRFVRKPSAQASLEDIVKIGGSLSRLNSTEATKDPERYMYLDRDLAARKVEELRTRPIDRFDATVDMIESTGYTTDDGRTVNMIGVFNHHTVVVA
jgi:hypothetical protein